MSKHKLENHILIQVFATYLLLVNNSLGVAIGIGIVIFIASGIYYGHIKPKLKTKR